MENTFKPIETQEQLDAFMSDRINRLNAKHSEAAAEFQSKIAELTEQLNTANETIKNNTSTFAEMETKIKAYEADSVKTKIAKEEGIPYEMRGRISGSTEDEMRQDARMIASFFKTPVAPLPSAEPKPTNGAGSTETALDGWLKSLKNN